MNNLQYIVKDGTRYAMHVAVELCEQGDFDNVTDAFRWLMLECDDSKLHAICDECYWEEAKETMIDETPLLSCPFCGGSVTRIAARQLDDGIYYPAACGCRSCGIWRYGDFDYGHGGFATKEDYKVSMEQAVLKWNTRIPEQELIELAHNAWSMALCAMQGMPIPAEWGDAVERGLCKRGINVDEELAGFEAIDE